MPSLERLAARLPPDRFAVVAVKTRDKIAFDTNSGPLSLRRKAGGGALWRAAVSLAFKRPIQVSI